jgi:signal transduction histidine kinase
MGSGQVLPGADPPVRAETVHQSERTRVTRLFLPGGTVIRKEPLGPSGERRVRHEVAMLERLRGMTGVAQLAAAPQYPGSAVIADAGAATLAGQAKPLAVADLIGLGLGLGRAVAGMHRRGVMHRDITPANIVLSGDGAPCLVDFALASSLAEIRPEFTHHSEIVGTLAYLAPEATGRTGQPVDQRADLYALGAVLYEQATGAPPFGSGDPLRLTHDHLARAPAPPAQVNPAVPDALSRIILHLLEKEPDNRYQTADGLVYDLERVRHANADPVAGVFRVGERDVPVRLQPPSRLAGRDDEVAALEAAFADALAGQCRGVLVAGPPGVGKTALADQLRPVVTGADGWFVAGKFDAYRRDLEFDAAHQAFRALGRLLLAEPDEEVAQVRDRIVRAVGPNAGLLAAVLPEFAALLAVPPDAGDPLTAQTRVQRASAAALRAVASRKRPLVVFFDDLQWAGRTPLGFIDLVLSEEPVEGLLLVGAYREEEVDAAHVLAAPLSRWLEQAGVQRLRLVNLPEPSLATMIAEMLHVDRAAVEGLAEVIELHTRGNPYETVELLNALRRDGLLTATPLGWRWNEAAMRAHMGGSEVAGLLAARAGAMPEWSRAVVEAMACLGGRAELSLLRATTGESAGAVDQALAPALEEGLLVAEPGVHPAVRFRHDRIREAILDGLDPERRRAVQLAMARRLAGVPELFAAAAEQYLPVIDAVDEAAERRQVVGLLRRAAGQATLIGDYALVNTLLTAALPAVDPDQTGTLAEIHTGRHAALYCLGRLEEADEEYRTIERLCPAVLDRADATAVQVRSVTHRTRLAEAIRLGVESLRELGITVPAAERLQAELDDQFGYLYQWLDHTDPADDLTRPDLTDPSLLAACGLINATAPAAYFLGDAATTSWLGLEALRIFLEHGLAPALVTPAAFTAFGAVALRGDYAAAYRAARRILALGEASGYEPGTSNARAFFALFSCWAEPIENSVYAAQQAREGLIAGGDLANAGYTYYASVPGLLACSPALDRYLAEAEAAVAFARRTGSEQSDQVLDPYRWLAGVLRGDSTAAVGEAVPADRYAGNPLALLYAHINRAIAAAIFSDPVGLTRHTAAAMPLLPVAVGLYPSAVARLLRGLALAGQARSADGDECGSLLAELDEVTRWLAERAADAPDNFLHLLRLLEAERAWTAGDFRAAGLAYDAARREAAQRQRPWHQALIAEHAARFYLARGLEHAGYDLLAQARQQYLAWGATAKVGQLDWAYPGLQTLAEAAAGEGGLNQSRAVVTTGTIDLLGIVSASQALSSETSIGRLHARVVEVLSAMTGATGVHLMLWDEDRHGWLLPAPGGGTVPVGRTGHERAVPMSVLRYVQRTREPLVVADAVRDDRFARDPYFADIDCCSLLAVPILSRGALRAVLLPENRLVRAAFTTGRLSAVKLIAGQLAVSLDNAQLYAESRRIAGEQAALRRVATLVAQAAPPEQVFAAVAEQAGGLLGVDVAVLIRYDPHDAVTVVGAWTSTGAAAPTPVGSRLPLGGDNVTTLVFQTGQAGRTDYAEVSGVIGDVATRDWGLRSSVGVPITVGGRLWGAVVVALTREELLPADAEERLAEFTELVATAVADAQARTGLRGSAAEQAALRRVATLVAQAAPPEEVLAAIAEEAGRLLANDIAFLTRYAPGGTEIVLGAWASTGAPPVAVGVRMLLGGQNVSTLVFQTGRSARIDSYADATGPLGDLRREVGVRAAVGVPISVAGELWGVMIVASRSEPLPADTEARLAGFTELAAIAIANAQARMELRDYAEEQAALRRVAVLVARRDPASEVFAAIAAEAGRLLAADLTVMGRYEPDGGATFLAQWERTGVAAPVPLGTRFSPGGRNVHTMVFQTGRPARIDNYASATGPAAESAQEWDLRAVVAVPISVAGQLWGVIGVGTRQEPLSANTEVRLAGFAELASTAIVDAEAQDALAASRARVVAAADQARARIERDLHDGAQQRLVSLALQLRAAQAAMSPEVGAQLDHAVAEAVGALDELTEIARGIHPAILAERGLAPALNTLARRSPVPVDLQVQVNQRLPEPVEMSVYYVIAEALTNAAKHAGASTVSVKIEVARDGLLLEVRDDGAGGAGFSRGTGLAGLKDRVEALGGRIFLDSPSGAGTSLRVELPLTASDGGVITS